MMNRAAAWLLISAGLHSGQDPDLGRAPALITQLSTLRDSWTADDVRRRDAYVELYTLGPKAIPQIRSALKSPINSAQKISLAFLLADWNCSDAESLSRFEEMMNDSEPAVRALGAGILCYDSSEQSAAVLERSEEKRIRSEKALPLGRGRQSIEWLPDAKLKDLIRNSLAAVDDTKVFREPAPTSVLAAVGADQTFEALASLSVLSSAIRSSGRGHMAFTELLDQFAADPGQNAPALAFRLGLLAQFPHHEDASDESQCAERNQMMDRIVEAAAKWLWSAADPHVLAECHHVLSSLAVLGDSPRAIQELEKVESGHPNADLRTLAARALRDVKDRPKKADAQTRGVNREIVRPRPPPTAPPGGGPTRPPTSRSAEESGRGALWWVVGAVAFAILIGAGVHYRTRPRPGA